jgi:hypothetical protein
MTAMLAGARATPRAGLPNNGLQTDVVLPPSSVDPRG